MSIPPLTPPSLGDKLMRLNRDLQLLERQRKRVQEELKEALKQAVDEALQKPYEYAKQHLTGDSYQQYRKETLAGLIKLYGDFEDMREYIRDKVNRVFGPELSGPSLAL